MSGMYRNDEIKDIKLYILNNVIYDPDKGELWLRETKDQPETLIPITDVKSATIEYRGRVKINNKRILAARVAYLLVHGEWATGPIVCLNGSESDIRWSNIWEDESHRHSDMIAPDEQPDDSARIRESNKRYMNDLKTHHAYGCNELNIRTRGHIKHYSASVGFIGSSADLC